MSSEARLAVIPRKLAIAESLPSDTQKEPVKQFVRARPTLTTESKGQFKKRQISHLLAELSINAACFFITIGILRSFAISQGTSLNLARIAWLLPLSLVIWALLVWFTKTYQAIHKRDRIEEVWLLTRALILELVILLAAATLTNTPSDSRPVILLFIGLNALFLFGYRELAKEIIQHHKRLGYDLNFALIVGSGASAHALAQALRKSQGKNSHILGFLGETNGEERLSDPNSEIPVIGSTTDLSAVLKARVVDDVYFALPNKTSVDLDSLLKACDEVGVRFHITFPLFARLNSSARVTRFMGESFLSFSSAPTQDFKLALKRTMDIVGSLFLLILTTPLLIMVAVAIKLASRGPVIFQQERAGMNGRKFTLHKFRTMYDGAALERFELSKYNEMKGPVFKVRNDPRVTKLGRFLRRSSLDELPQLWNILKGDMSLVGPRPLPLYEVEQFEPWQRRRMTMRPGLTCSWQINGRNKVSDFNQWMTMDLEYIDQWTLLLDCEILLKTIHVVLTWNGAY